LISRLRVVAGWFAQPAPADLVDSGVSASLATIYDEAAYDLSIDYSAPPPPPPLSDEDAAWLQTLLEKSTTP
jgi:hypothetical protein